MSFSHRIAIRDGKAAKLTAEIVNQRRKQAQALLARQEKKKSQL
jgi:hypothetical protein